MLDDSFKMEAPKEAKTFDLLPDDIYEVSIKDISQIISDFKDQETGEDRLVLKFTFALSGEYDGRLQWCEVHPAAYIGAKGPTKLLQIVNAVRGVDLNKEEAKGVDEQTIKDLIGRNLRITVSHKTSKRDNVYNFVSGFMASKESKDEIPSLEVEF